jgi:ABC-type polar amino acid transport system ATPase subunit
MVGIAQTGSGKTLSVSIIKIINVGGEGWQEKVHNRGMEEAPENDRESSQSAHATGMNHHHHHLFSSVWLHSNIESSVQ